MKTVGAIPLIILLLFTGIKVSVATHYCCGRVAATRVSLTGEQASCGMEKDYGTKPLQDVFETHCCDNVTSTCSFSNNYFPSLYNYDNVQLKDIAPFNLHSDTLSFLEPPITSSDQPGRPPGTRFTNDVFLSSICVYRI